MHAEKDQTGYADALYETNASPVGANLYQLLTTLNVLQAYVLASMIIIYRSQYPDFTSEAVQVKTEYPVDTKFQKKKYRQPVRKAKYQSDVFNNVYKHVYFNFIYNERGCQCVDFGDFF